jgi:uncharacterized phage protein gp47/JayE
MATLAAQISATGIVAPDYADILQQLRIIYWSIYGSDVDLDPDKQDGQFLAVLAEAISDCNQTMIALYNSFSPSTAQGVALSSLIKINGLRRLNPSFSQCVVTVGGVVGTQINNGVIGDNQNLETQWTLPPLVTIPAGGTVNVTATCTVAGATAAGHDTLTNILTPTLGWQTVTNAASASPGQPVETDVQVRTRQSSSVALPAMTILQGIFAAVDAVTGVTDLAIYENSSDATDGNGIPRHSIAVVVLGGDVNQVASAIALKKSPGVGTQGTTSVTVTDSNGVPNVIKFYPLTVVPLSVIITIHPLTGYVSTTGDALKAAVAAFVNGLVIGEESYLNRLFSPANLGGMGLGATFVVTGITQAIKPAAPAAADVPIAFNETASLAVSDITLVLA